MAASFPRRRESAPDRAGPSPARGQRAARGLPPVVDAGIETLILGSFPGVASLERQQYYGHPQNQFWRLVGAAIGVPLAEMDYAARTRALLAHRIGLWDVIRSCRRTGSLDAAIRDARANDFAPVVRAARRLRRVCFNGKTAARRADEFAALGYAICVLPSSSPAHTLPFARKLEAWRALAAPCDAQPRAARAAGTPC